MTFQESIRTCFQKYVVISGRAQRSEYWWWFLFTFLGNAILNLLDSAMFGSEPGSAAILGPIFALATVLPSICVAGRRLHDRDMSAWWILIVLIPIIGGIILLIMLALEGTKGPNRFGPDPLGRGSGGGMDPATYSQSSIPRAGRSDDT